MEQVVLLIFGIIISALVALLGKNRKIGYGWSFVLCLFLTPIIGLIIILFSKKNDVEFVDIPKEETNN
jgi:phosphoglycerol transferase MdoB-like AlkP superfamily enzyme